MKAYILINAGLGVVSDVLDDLRKINEIKSANSTAGPYDIIAFMESSDLSSLGDTIVQKIQKVPGVSKTLTCIIIE
ncbi:hypothetical protein ES705_01334 [subsurface metagenome]|jgi:DNA-binding Lrp family transcriptional regulator|uniref:Transcription regulator AsnC/Lrp ligand binding domain-containing protein n=2 Tax=marine sediment metagenome TaxID=412755 RepID=X0Z2G0_9ZZZZ|nr:Lrp/AsnC family transcriptional regulator [Clostridia bacterium]TET13578.1 MAG: Lrp/AsnC family transcriptional regulator [Actinomycetota bacterium]